MFGFVNKLKAKVEEPLNPLDYVLPINNTEIPLNPLLGKPLSIHFLGKIECIGCGKNTKKSYQQGHCFPCTQTLARCDICIVRPEKCHFHLGTCREPEWAETHCMIPHVIYLANTSGLKVGITRETQIPTRWIDQGAIQALPIARVRSRYAAGLLEVSLAKQFADKTAWRKMLSADCKVMDLKSAWQEHEFFGNDRLGFKVDGTDSHEVEWLDLEKEDVRHFSYPVLEYPKKIHSLSLKQDEPISGILLGIKGQYLIFDVGVINVRNMVGHQIRLEF